MEKDGSMVLFYDYLRQYIGNYEYWIKYMNPQGKQKPDTVNYEIDLESIKGIDYDNYYHEPVKFRELPKSMQKVAEACLLHILRDFGEVDIEMAKKIYHLL